MPIVNVPNQITLARLAISIIFLALLATIDARTLDDARGLLQVCFWLFIVAAVSDIVDGYLARRLNAETTFGRIVDPLVDKILICGAFIEFSGAAFTAGGRHITGVAGWMATVIVARELLVSGLRASIESSGRSFGADGIGKVKMFVQCLAVGFVLGRHAWDLAVLDGLMRTLVWLAVLVTAASAVTYSYRAGKLLAGPAAVGKLRARPRASVERSVKPAVAAAPVVAETAP